MPLYPKFRIMNIKKLLKGALVVVIVLAGAFGIWYWQFTRSLDRDMAKLGKGLSEMSQGLQQLSNGLSGIGDTITLDSLSSQDSIKVID